LDFQIVANGSAVTFDTVSGIRQPGESSLSALPPLPLATSENLSRHPVHLRSGAFNGGALSLGAAGFLCRRASARKSD
jgi:hypothetical protein